MRYLIQQNGIYYFRRRIPKSNRNFTFSTRSRNVRIALGVTTMFLTLSDPLFCFLKTFEKDHIMENMKKILELLEEYQQRAIQEYGEEEKSRHADLTCIDENGRKLQGGHPHCIEIWLRNLQDAVLAGDVDDETFRRIFRRTGISEELYDELSSDEKEEFKALTIKNEAFIIKEDLHRTKQRFDPDFAPIQSTYYKTSPAERPGYENKYYEKTAEEIFDDFIQYKKKDTAEIHKYKEPIDVLFNVAKKKYLKDIDADDMKDFIFTIKNLPNRNTKKSRELYNEFSEDYYALAQYTQEHLPDLSISLKTALEKIRRVNAFLDYAVSVERLDRNRLKIKVIMPSTQEKREFEKNEKKKRKPFHTDELNKLFNQSPWYKDEIIKNLRSNQDKFFIPLIGLLQGMRLNEIAQLYLDDIVLNHGIPCIMVRDDKKDQQLKNATAERLIPIHSKLVDLGLFAYIEELQKKKEKRLFPQLYHTKGKGYGQAFSKKFNNRKFKETWVDKDRLEDRRIMTDFHSLRHTFSTRLAEVENRPMVSALLGHGQLSETDKTYTHRDMIMLHKTIHQLDLDGINFDEIVYQAQKFYNIT